MKKPSGKKTASKGTYKKEAMAPRPPILKPKKDDEKKVAMKKSGRKGKC